MMRKLILLGTLLFCSFGLIAQNSLIVIQARGQVEHMAKDGTTSRIVAGMEIPAIGALIVGAGAKAKLLFSGKPIELNKQGRYDLQTLTGNSDGKKSRGFMNRFWDFIDEGVSNTCDDEKLQKYHQKYMEQTTGGISGFGKGKYSIVAFDLACGILA